MWRIIFWLVAAVLPFAARAQLRLNTAVRPYGTTEVHQMAFDATNNTLYLTNTQRRTIVQVSDASTVPLTPSYAARWSFSIVAGRDGVRGRPGDTERYSTSAIFDWPTGVVGWPLYAVGGFKTPGAAASKSWAGLWVADGNNHALSFIHFQRGNNVTLVAGSPNGSSGARDGIGAAALLYRPNQLAWGRFFRAAVTGAETAPTTERPKAWTSVVYWTDNLNECVRQGIPVRNDTGHSYLDDGGVLVDMVLNVSTFAGRCGSGNNGNEVGFVTSGSTWFKMFSHLWGIALVGLPIAPATSNTTAVLFVGDYGNRRVAMIAPMYPLTARTLTAVYQHADQDIDFRTLGLTIGRVRSRTLDATAWGSTIVVVVELGVGSYNFDFSNVTVALSVSTVTTNVSQVVTLGQYEAASIRVFARSGIYWTRNTVMVPRMVNSTTNGTLVVFSGVYYGRRYDAVLEFYCCLDASYSEPIPLEGTTTVTVDPSKALPTATSTTVGPAPDLPPTVPDEKALAVIGVIGIVFLIALLVPTVLIIGIFCYKRVLRYDDGVSKTAEVPIQSTYTDGVVMNGSAHDPSAALESTPAVGASV